MAAADGAVDLAAIWMLFDDAAARQRAIDTYAAPARRDYEHAFDERLQTLEKFCQRYAVHLMPMSTDDDPVSSLQTALGRRTH